MLGRSRATAAGLVAAGACCLSALGAQAASAEEAPQFYTKAPVGGAAPSEIKETYSIGVTYLEGHASKAKIECAKGSGSAVVDGPKSVKEVRIKLVECEVPHVLIRPNGCENRGTNTKEIETNNLVGELGLITSTKDGLRLTAESGAYLMEFECLGGAIMLKVKGALLGEITGAETAGNTIAEAKFRASGDLKFAQSGGIQKWTKFLGESTGQQLENVVTEGGKEHEELVGQSMSILVKPVPPDQIGETT